MLFSGDGDFCSLLEAVQRQGVHVSVISSLRSKPPMIADGLRRQADTDGWRTHPARAPLSAARLRAPTEIAAMIGQWVAFNALLAGLGLAGATPALADGISGGVEARDSATGTERLDAEQRATACSSLSRRRQCHRQRSSVGIRGHLPAHQLARVMAQRCLSLPPLSLHRSRGARLCRRHSTPHAWRTERPRSQSQCRRHRCIAHRDRTLPARSQFRLSRGWRLPARPDLGHLSRGADAGNVGAHGTIAFSIIRSGDGS
jgi:hypothetical protein